MHPDVTAPDLSCRDCGNRVRALARFCDACGSPVGSDGRPGERKQVTVLFADVVESMKLAAALDPERLREIMHDLARDIWLRERALFMVPVADLWAARQRARRGDRDAAIPVMRQAVDELHQAGRLGYGVWGTGVLVETLLERGVEGDLAEAQEAIDRLARLRADPGSAIPKITLLRLRALLARARADETAYRDYRDRYRTMANSLKFDGHIAWADAMP